MALCGAALGEATNPNWGLVDNQNGTATYSITLNGSFNINLGDAAIKDGESFSMTIEATAPAWANEWGTAIAGTANPYANQQAADNFRVYFGNPAKENQKVVYSLNNWEYTKQGAEVDYSGVPSTPSTETPLTLGFTFTYVNSKDAGWPEGTAESNSEGNYFQITNSANSNVKFNATDYNIVRSFNFSTLTNVGDVAVTDGTITTISITKAYTIPEPATATLSLLALAGLAARRRRK